MTNLVVRECSDLVRSLESKLTSRSQATHGRPGNKIQYSICQATVEQTIEEERLELAGVKAELQKLKSDDNAAAKTVSRYM
jgi:hypothetical protein